MTAADAIRKLTKSKRQKLAALLMPRLNAYIPHCPTAKQTAFLLLPHREALYGGGAGGGKSDCVLMGALQHADVPGYSALILRRTYAQLAKAGALIQRSHEWLASSDAQWNGETKTWRFPSGATVEFGHIQHAQDRYIYQGAEYDYIAFDELTDFDELTYRFMFSRLRRRTGSSIPLRCRSASNPGGPGHEWVRGRFVEQSAAERPFVPALLADNPHIDIEAYRESLAHLDPITRAQIEHGDWTARRSGSMFRREWLMPIVDTVPPGTAVRYWDLAASEASEGNDPDWTAGLRMSLAADGRITIVNVQRVRARPGRRDALIRQTAELDGKGVPIWIEQEPGASGKAQIDYFVRDLLAGWEVRGYRPTGDKVTRAGPFASQAEAGNVRLLRGEWNGAFLDELESFPDGGHDDQVDTASGAYEQLATRLEPIATW